MITRYEDFEVIVTKQGDQLLAELGTAPGGRHLTNSIPITLPDDRVAWAEAKQGRKSEAELAELGHGLFRAFVKGELADNWNACLGEIRRQPDTGLRLRFSSQAEALTEVPLELLCRRAAPTRDFLALDPRTPIVRSPRHGAEVGERLITLPLKMLVVIASPRRQVRIDSVAEQACLEAALANLLQAGKLLVDYLGVADCPRADYDTLHHTLTQAEHGPYDIVHFIAHGCLPDAGDRECEGILLLVDPQNERRQDVRASDLARILAPNGVRVVVLQACEGARPGVYNAFQGVAQQLIAGGLPAAVAMQCRVDKDVATCFCGELYQFWLAESGLPLERAVTEARQTVRQRFPDQALAWGTPVLFIRLDSTEVLNVTLGERPEPGIVEGGNGSKNVQAYLDALTRLPEFARWADQGEDHYIETESKVLPLFASPYDDDTGQQRENLLKIIRNHERLLILGEPGVGKTAALERMVWETVSAKGSVVPIYVPLSYYSGDLMAEVHSALTETGVLHFRNAQDLDNFLHQNPCLVLFDGLNEVRRDQRRQIVRDIAKFVHDYRRHRYVVTSRSQDVLWRTLRREDGVVRDAVVVQSITDDQVREYLIAHIGDQKGNETHDSLNECLRRMSRTPLFLWMLKEVRLEGRELPGNRGELFDQFVETLFERDERKLKPSVPRSAKKQALARLAFSLQQEYRVACREEEAIAIVSGTEVEHDPQVLVGEAQMHGLLKRMERKEKRQLRFMHQAVQEYFVALALREIVPQEVDNPAWQKLGKRVLRRGLATWASDPRWAESFVQLAGLTGHPSWLAREIARVNPWLAFWCMIEGQEIDEEAQRVIEAKTVNLLHSDDVRERWNAVQELGRLENPRTAGYLVGVLGDETEGIVKVAVQGLGKLGEPAVEPLLLCLHRDDIRVRQAATMALGTVWQLPQLVNLGNADVSLRLAALENLGQRGESRAVEAIVAVACWDMDLAVRQRAVEVLGQLGDTRAVGPLLTLLADEPSLRARAVTALGQIRDERAVEPLTKVLRDNDEVVRCGAITALGRIWELQQLVRLGDEREVVRGHAAATLGQLGDMRAVQPLVAALRDSTGAVCASAATALGQLGDVQTVTPLISVLLTRDEPTARRSAAEALGKMDDRRAVEPLIVALKDQERDVRRSVATALGQLRDERAIGPLIEICRDRYVQGSSVKALAQIGRPAVQPLIVALKNGERDVRASAAIALGQIGGIQAFEALLVSLRDDDLVVCASVAVALGQVGNAQAVPALAITLREDRGRMARAGAAMSLGRLGGAQAIKALTSTLQDKDEDEAVWRMAIGALGRIWNLPHVVRLSDKDAKVRRSAAIALGQLGDERGIEPLLTTLRDQDETVRRRATSALGRIWNLPQLVRLGDDEAEVRQSVITVLEQLRDTRAVEPLIAALRRDSSAAVRVAAAKALGHLDDERAVPPLIEALDDDDRDVQRGASEALQRLERLATPDLIAALRDSNYWYRRRKAAETLASIGDLASLIEALKHKDRFVRRSATEELVQRGDTRAVEPLIGVLRDDDDFVRRKAAEALGKIGDASAVGPLIEAMRDGNWHVRLVVTEALGNIKDRSTVESLIAALQDDKWPVRWMAAKALGKLRDSRAVGPLSEALEGKWPAVWTVAEALGQLQDDRAVESLVAALRDSDTDQYVQQAAVEALGHIGEPIQKPLIDVLQDGDEGARQRAIAALGQMRDARDLTPLIEALRSGPSYEVWQGAMEALVQLGEPAVKPLVAVLRGDEWMARRRAARALGRIEGIRAVKPLVEALGDRIRSVRQAAAEALERIDTPEARSAVRRYEGTYPGEWPPAEE